MTDSTRTIWRSAARFFSGTMLSRVSGMLRDMAMAFSFGTESAVAALLVAFRLAHLLRRLLGEGAMQTALIPYFEELRTESRERAANFFCDLSATLSVIIGLIVIVTMGATYSLIHYNLLSEGNAEIAWLTFLMMPSLLFICLFGINASLMQCEKSYFTSSAAPIVFNLLWIIGVACTYKFPAEQAMTYLSLFIIAACFAQWAVTLPKVYILLKQFGVNSLFSNAKFFTKDVISLAKPLSLGIIGIAASQINNALDSIFARWATLEGPAILWYAIRLQQLPLALFGVALAGALLPPLSRAAKSNDGALFSSFLEFATLKTLALMLPITAIIFVMGDLCVALIYGHGSFTNASVVETTQALWGYTIGLIPMALILVLAPAFYAKGDFRTPSLASAASMGINVILNFVMVAILGAGAASIAFVTSISAWFNFMWLYFAIRKTAHILPKMRSLLMATMIASFSVIAFNIVMTGHSKAIEILLGEIPFYEVPLLLQITNLGFNGLLFLGVFAASNGLKPLLSQKPT